MRAPLLLPLVVVGCAASAPTPAEAPARELSDLEREIQDEIRVERRADEAIRSIPSRWSRVGCLEPGKDVRDLYAETIRYRRLRRNDFLARQKPKDARPVVRLPRSQVGANVAVGIVCYAEIATRQNPDGAFEAWLRGLRYVVVLDRGKSWWNPEARAPADWILRHEQVHFDLGELRARELNEQRRQIVEETRATGPNRPEAIAALWKRWNLHLDRVQEEFRELEHRYDRETRHGTLIDEQTRWYEQTLRQLAKTKGGLAARR